MMTTAEGEDGDEGKIARPWTIFACCTLVLLASGYVLQLFSFLLPSLVQAGLLPTPWRGPLLSAAMVGLMIGYILLAPLTDRHGGRIVLLSSLAALTASIILCIMTRSIVWLAIARLISGMAIGAAIPCVVAITSHQERLTWRGARVVLSYSGFSLGFLAASLACGALFPRWGWAAPWMPALFVCLIAFALALRCVPAQWPRPVERTTGVLPKALWTGELRGATLLLWAIFSVNLGLFYALQNWLPSLVGEAGGSLSRTVSLASMISIGASLAPVPIILLGRYCGPFQTLAIIYGLGLLGFLGLGHYIHSAPLLLLAAGFLAGTGMGGGQKSAIAAASLFYPAPMRATGLGWALGLGRIGAISGPLLVGLFLERGTSPALILIAMAGPAGLLLIAALLLDRLDRREGSPDL